jgi:DNA polymerase-1
VNAASLSASLEDLELFSLVKQVGNFARIFSAEPPPELSPQLPPEASVDGTEARPGPKSVERAGQGPTPAGKGDLGPAVGAQTGSPDQAFKLSQPNSEPGQLPPLAPQLIGSEGELQALVERLWATTDPASPIALDTETTALNPFQAELVGIGLCWGEALTDLAYIPIGHHPPAAAES